MRYPIGPRLRKIRRARDLTQTALADRAGIDHMTISRIEAGRAVQIYADTLLALAQALGVSAEFLAGVPEPAAAGFAVLPDPD